MPTLLHRLMKYRPFTALVVGDFMLDEYLTGAAERLSPDAPVPVLLATGREDQPGGAAHVARCLSTLGGTVHCFGVVGADAEGKRLTAALEAAGCRPQGIIEDPHRPTTIKRSMIGLAQHRHPQKMFRVDIEVTDPLPPNLLAMLLERFDRVLAGADVVCLEDYNKGVACPELCRSLIARCRAAGKPILVDPAAIADYGKYRGATAITPNRSEAELATGLDTPIDASEIHNAGLAAKLLDELDLEAVLLTLDRHGALLQERGGPPRLIPTVARNVYDVTGAGDMVLAALATAVANGAGWSDAALIANAAAGLEVEVFGAQPIPMPAVQREVMRMVQQRGDKLRSHAELEVELAVHRGAGERIVFTNGCFDVIHAGHVAYLKEAAALGDLLVVAVNGDAQVRAQKGSGRPIYPVAERLEILNELRCVNYLTVFEEPTVHELLRKIRPNVFAKGGDYRPEEINEHDLAVELGIELRVLTHRPGRSSSAVVEQLGEGVVVTTSSAGRVNPQRS